MNTSPTRLFIAALLTTYPLASFAAAAPKATDKAVVKPTTPAKTALPSKPTPSIKLPAYTDVPQEFSFEGDQKDLLGVAQSLLGGLTSGIKPDNPNASGAAKLFSDAELVKMVSQIHQIHAISLSFESKGNEARQAALKPNQNDSRKLDDIENERLSKAQKFYADKFTQAGGKPQLTLQNNNTSVSVYVFKASNSWALLTCGPSRVIVVRADGYPNLAIIGRLVGQSMSQ